jgi:riboflavin kinase / FMN adenylyltransferase
MSKGSEKKSTSIPAKEKSRSSRETAVGIIIRGSVVHGNHIGRTLGFPTANIQPEQNFTYQIPNGVYFARVFLGTGRYYGLCNIGLRPTIGGKNVVIEVNILDFSEDIYGEPISVEILRTLRKEKKFKDLGQLVDQIKLDKIKAGKILSALNKNDRC